MKLEIHAVNDIGCSRTNNEDMMSVGGILLRDASLELPVEIDDESDSYFYILVSDGMGGHEKGEEASELLLKCISDSFMDGRISPENAEENLRKLVYEVSCTLNMRGIEENQERILGCTLTGVIWIGARTYLVNAGDSRTYRLRSGILKQLTTDDTERGITGDENASKLLLNAIGGGSHGRLTVEDITDRIMEGDTILVCSDGLTDMVDDEGIEEILCRNERPAESLVETANRNGGADNISVIVAHLEN
ncbi:MAG: serine/threonine-protein phosphatase [Bacteroidales bacterium]|nr:serine/threonine-protein phosphatase [Bacteroidales bacterium]